MRDVDYSGGRCKTRCHVKPQAAREKAARVILAEAEVEIANRFSVAAESYPRQSDGAPPACDEHALRRIEGERAPSCSCRAAPLSHGYGVDCLGAAALRQQKLTGSDEPVE
jgi:hypothetical protein